MYRLIANALIGKVKVFTNPLAKNLSMYSAENETV
jgi:hypothetical protein